MSNSASWTINQSKEQPFANQSKHAMAWARDSITGEPVYIQELGPDRTGAKCGCECPSCELPLTGVNVAKTEYRKRPHFRHPNGSVATDCLVLSARLAAMQLLKEEGVFTLPGRRVLARVVGLSGFEYEAWVEHPPEKVRFKNFDFRDRAVALLTLDDGRQLRVVLTGTCAAPMIDADGLPIPMIILDVNDVNLASMSTKELRSKLTLLPDNFCWVSHWWDQFLQESAATQAKKKADNFLDLEPDDESILEGVPAEYRHETLLHLEVKRILSESKEIAVPSIHADVDKLDGNKKSHSLHWARHSWVIDLHDVQLEKRFGNIIPDVVAKVSSTNGDVLLIEITVTNHITEERKLRICAKNLPTLEIDLSQSVGQISRANLTKWVVHGLSIKQWLHHPEIEAQKLVLIDELAQKVERIDLKEKERIEFKSEVMAADLNSLARDYLGAVMDLAQYNKQEIVDNDMREKIDFSRKAFEFEAGKLKIRGYPEAENPVLVDSDQAIISRISNIKNRQVFGQTKSAMEILYLAKKSRLCDLANMIPFLIAENAYREPNQPVSTIPEWHVMWVESIKDSVRNRETTYLRSGEFDRLLSLIFPEMSKGLATEYGLRKRSKNSAPVVKSQTQVPIRAINFVDVLHEAQLLKRGDTYGKWFEIWSDRYVLNFDVSLIARYLDSHGFTNALEALEKWESRVVGMKRTGMQPLRKSDLEPTWVKPQTLRQPAVIIKIKTGETTPEDNPYARRKG